MESFHKFYSTVQQIQISLHSLLSGINSGNNLRLDEELDAIDKTVGFGRKRKARSRSKKNEKEPVLRTSTRAQVRRAKVPLTNVNCSSTEENDKFPFNDSTVFEEALPGPPSPIKTRKKVELERATVIQSEKVEETAFEEVDVDNTAAQKKNIKDDDLSSLEVICHETVLCLLSCKTFENSNRFFLLFPLGSRLGWTRN